MGDPGIVRPLPNLSAQIQDCGRGDTVHESEQRHSDQDDQYQNEGAIAALRPLQQGDSDVELSRLGSTRTRSSCQVAVVVRDS